MNICPYQASRTIRTEEAVMITLARMSPHVLQNIIQSDNNNDNDNDNDNKQIQKNSVVKVVEFSDSEPSDESSVEENK